MNSYKKYFSACLLALLGQAALAQSNAPPLSTGLQSFAVLSGGAFTCTDSVVVGDVGAAVTPTNTRCAIAGQTHQNDPAFHSAYADFQSAYAALQAKTCTQTLTGTLAGRTLTPGVYCFTAAATLTGTLTLNAQGNANAVWIFKTGAALTGTDFSVVMTNGGQACNVYWVPTAAATMTTSALKGNIVAGGATGEITLTGGSLVGRALARVAVTTTDSLIGCGVPAAALPSASSCKPKKHHKHKKGHGRDGHDDHDDDDDDDDDDKRDYRHTPKPYGRK